MYRATISPTMRIACCIAAAGQGTRLGDEWKNVPKAMVPLLGRPMLYYTLHAFDKFGGLHQEGAIERFVVTSPKGSVDQFAKHVKAWGFSRPVKIVPGGETRADSVFNALSELKNDPPDWVLISDCARACLTDGMVWLLVDKAKETGIPATLAHPATDTLRVTENSLIVRELDRSSVACLETPQLFPYAKIMELHASASDRNELPDDTTLFTRSGSKVHVVYHDGSNLKITHPEDIAAAEGILFGRGWQDVSEGED